MNLRSDRRLLGKRRGYVTGISVKAATIAKVGLEVRPAEKTRPFPRPRQLGRNPAGGGDENRLLDRCPAAWCGQASGRGKRRQAWRSDPGASMPEPQVENP